MTKKEIAAPQSPHLNTIPLSVFYDCLRSENITLISKYVTDEPVTIHDDMPDYRNVISKVKNPIYGAWIGILIEYAAHAGIWCDEKKYCKIAGELLGLQMEFIRSSANVTFLHSPFWLQAAADALNGAYPVNITRDNVGGEIVRVKSIICDAMKPFNELYRQFLSLKPKHNRAHFLNVIAKMQKECALFPANTPARKIFDTITLFEYLQYLDTIKAK